VLGVGVGRFVVQDSSGEIETELTGSLHAQLALPVARARAALYLTTGARAMGVEHLELREDVLADAMRVVTPETRRIVDRLVRGATPKDLVLGGIYYAPNGPNSTRPNLLLMNDRTGRFAPDPNFTLPPKLHGIEGVTPRIFTADFDGNGAPDILMSTDRGAVDPGLQLLLNDGTGRLRDASAQLNLTFPQTDNWVVGTQIVDLNRDGRPDIVLRTNTETFNHATYSRSLLLNKGGGVFVDDDEASGGAVRGGAGDGGVEQSGDGVDSGNDAVEGGCGAERGADGVFCGWDCDDQAAAGREQGWAGPVSVWAGGGFGCRGDGDAGGGCGVVGGGDLVGVSGVSGVVV
jgi:hypothetical protein